MNVFTRSPIQFTGTDYLKKIASAIAGRVGVKVVYLPVDSTDVTHANMLTNTVYIKESDAWLYGDDYVVGNLLHEIGHIQHTPRDFGVFVREANAKDGTIVPDTLMSLYNMVEDRRMEVEVRKTVAGAPYYLAEMNSRALSSLADSLEQPVPYTGTTDKEAMKGLKMMAATRLVQTGHYDGTASEALVEYAGSCEREAKEHILWRILGYACVKQAGMPTTATLAAKEWRDAADMVVAMCDKAEHASAEEVKQIALDVYNVLRPWIAHQQDNPQSFARMIEKMKSIGGHQPSHDDKNSKKDASELMRYTMADGAAMSKVAALKKLLLARMRENEHMKYVGGKKKGLLDKRALSRVARDNFRVYRKREDIKGRKYCASVVLDCSGSMWNKKRDAEGRTARSETITIADVAMTASALIIRTLRAIKVPTSLSIFGYDTKTVLRHEDRYLVEEMSRTMAMSGHDFYRSGDNATATALEHALPRLRKASGGKHRLLFFITDGGLMGSDIDSSKLQLQAEIKRGNFTPMILYIGVQDKILHDPRYERECNSVDELVPTIVDALKALDV